MKYSISEDVLNTFNLTLDDFLVLLLIHQEADIQSTIKSLENREAIVYYNNMYLITPEWTDKIHKILLESDKDIPKTNDLVSLVKDIREIFPKGIKEGTKSSAWRGNIREITLRMQKFFKVYGNTYSYDDIINATKRYVESFNGNYTYMRILKYFILKDEVKLGEDGSKYVEQVSELANFLENNTEVTNNEWTVELR